MAVHLAGGIDVMMEELAPRRAVYLAAIPSNPTL